LSLPKLEEFCEECRPKAEKIYRYMKDLHKKIDENLREIDQIIDEIRRPKS